MTLPTANKLPIGNFEGASAAAGTVTVSGWALDLNVTSSIQVHVYVDGVGRPFVADASRPDVAAAYPGYGDRHGFVAQVPAAPGAHQVCVYAIDNAGGGNPTLGCRTVTVPGTAAAANHSPFGNFEGISAVAGAITVSGWAIDPDTSASIGVHVYVDGVGRAFVANVNRPDVGAAYPSAGPEHGFVVTVPASAGPHQVCAYAIDSAGGTNTTLGCRSITAP